MTMGKLVRRMVDAFAKGDHAGFRTAVRELAEEERRKNHHHFARDLEVLLGCENGSLARHVKALPSLSVESGEIPRDKERGAVLVEMSSPARCLDDLVLNATTRESIDRIIEENRRAEVLRAHGLKPIQRILFCGPAGCGKTATAEAVAKELYLPLVLVRFDAVVSSYLGETAANLRQVFDFARSRPMIVLFDEFDAIGKRRTDDAEHGELKRVVNSFLQMVDSFRGAAVLIAATNHQGLLDPALWRRFDDIILFDQPSAPEIETLLTRMLQQVGVSNSVRLATVARSLKGVAHADVERIALDAIKQAMLEDAPSIDQAILELSISRQRRRADVTEGRAKSNGLSSNRRRR